MKLILELKLAIVLLVFRLSKGNEILQQVSNFDDRLDILQVLNTSEKLWLYKESYNNWGSTKREGNNINLSYICLNFHKISLSASQYNFTEQFKDHEEWESVNYAAKIVYNDTLRTHPPKSMEILDRGGKKTELMTLQYTETGSYTCSVFFVSSLHSTISTDTVACDMYIRDSAVDKRPPAGCEAFFQHPLHRDSVSDIFHGMQEQQL
uniref:Putative lipocalin-2 1 n=1 Tax=Amblyomma tuberculatum TaxID=48802 RepID=A0A6M2E503_9ACAR